MDATRRQTLRGRIGLHQQIHHIVARQVPSFEQDSARAHRQQIASCRLQDTGVRYISTQQQNSFIQVWRDEGRARKQLAHQDLHRFTGNQAVPTGSHHHGIQHHVFQLVVVDSPSHYIDNFWGMQHADLDGINANVVHHRLNLGFEKLGWYAVNTLHTLGVLRSQSCDGSHAEAAQGSKGFQIGLDACSAAAVRSCNGQYTGVVLRRMLLISHTRNYAQCLVNSLCGLEI